MLSTVSQVIWLSPAKTTSVGNGTPTQCRGRIRDRWASGCHSHAFQLSPEVAATKGITQCVCRKVIQAQADAITAMAEIAGGLCDDT